MKFKDREIICLFYRVLCEFCAIHACHPKYDKNQRFMLISYQNI